MNLLLETLSLRVSQKPMNWKTIQTPTLQPDKVTAHSGRLRLGMLLDQLENLKVHIIHYEQEIQAILDKLPESTSVKNLPGVGERLAPELVATLGPNSKDSHHRFQAAEEIANSPAAYRLSE